ncbi:MAG: hypothetical protein JRG81_17215 [Deltaproteobacteria bacterium]|nr:hypothetical protein [Deltaproteobacteria bacterium]MBW2365674.1 hypothetical protein [Deltaproteobacteria bacterium]
MRGAFFIIMAIVLLIIGILVIKDMQTETVTGIQKKDIVEHTEKVADEIEDKMDSLKKKIDKVD